MTSGEDREYVLGTHDDELTRLGFQHRIWSESATALWERAGLTRGMRALDVGCGPGFATRDLALIVGDGGMVTGVDISSRFIEYARRRSVETEGAGGARLEFEVADVQSLDLAPSSFDFAYARWVLCFVPNPGAVIDGVMRALRPGGVFAIQDYNFYRSVRIHPTSPAFEHALDAVNESWRLGGGDPDIGGRLPTMLRERGATVRELRPLHRLARPGGLLWNWPATFFRNYLPSLVEKGLLSNDDRVAFERDFAARSNDPGAYFTTPSMIEIIAAKGDH
ncbi:MAG: methyltransferase domain-containing protein [Phycisphaerales bacterium]